MQIFFLFYYYAIYNDYFLYFFFINSTMIIIIHILYNFYFYWMYTINRSNAHWFQQSSMISFLMIVFKKNIFSIYLYIDFGLCKWRWIKSCIRRYCIIILHLSIRIPGCTDIKPSIQQAKLYSNEVGQKSLAPPCFEKIYIIIFVSFFNFEKR